MRTPLRYPGGKTRFSVRFSQIIEESKIDNPIFVEPYCGGAGAAITLLLTDKVKEIYLNDADRSIYAFWHTVLNDSERLIRKMHRMPVTLAMFDKQKSVQAKKNVAKLFDLGFSTLFLNRTAFSGVISGGPIGGRKQSGSYRLDCRFNKKEIAKRIRGITRRRASIEIFNKDAEDFLQLPKIVKLPKEKTIFYMDPPYLEKGALLYQNNYLLEDHKRIERFLRTYDKNIYVSYDDCREIRKIYAAWNKRRVRVPHRAGKFKIGREVILCRGSV